MLYTIALILAIIWLIGVLGFHTGGIIHILLVLALVALVVRLFQGKK